MLGPPMQQKLCVPGSGVGLPLTCVARRHHSSWAPLDIIGCHWALLGVVVCHWVQLGVIRFVPNHIPGHHARPSRTIPSTIPGLHHKTVQDHSMTILRTILRLHHKTTQDCSRTACIQGKQAAEKATGATLPSRTSDEAVGKLYFIVM